jgi:hypothetical protein
MARESKSCLVQGLERCSWHIENTLSEIEDRVYDQEADNPKDARAKLGKGIAQVFGFVRGQLWVPLDHRLKDDPLANVVYGVGARHKKTVCGWVSRIYESLKIESMTELCQEAPSC